MTNKNENRLGYKKTKVGWIPEEWECKQLGAICNLKAGTFIAASRILENKKEKTYPCYGGNGLRGYVESYTHDGCFPLIGRQGALCGNIKKSSGKFYATEHAVVATFYRVNDTHWLYFGLVNAKLNRYATGVAQPGLSVENIKKISLPLPPVPEQKKIAKILSTWDRAIELTEKLITKCELRKKGLVQLTINRGQLAINSKQLLVNTKEWENVKLGDIFKRVKRKNSIGEPRVLTASGEHGLIDQKEYFNRSVAGKNLSGYYLLKKGEFAYNRSFMNGYPYGAIKRLERYNAGIVSTLYLCFALQNKCCDENFYTHLFESGVLNKELRCIVQMGARAHGLLNVTASDFLNIKIALPPLDEQKHITKILDTADKEINKLKSKLEALKEQKKGMMQKLLTGEVRTTPGTAELQLG